MIEGTIPARTVSLIWAAAIRAGVPRSELTAIHPTVNPTTFGNDLLRVPGTWAPRVWELLDAAVGPGAGLLAMETAERGGLYVWDYLFTSEPTLAASVRAAVELRAVVTDPGVGWEVVEDGGLLSIRDTTPLWPECVRPVQEFTLALMLRRVREATRRPLVPVRVAFTHRESRRYRHLIDEFGTRRIDFGTPYAEIAFLDAGRLPTGADPHLGAMLRHYAELFLASSQPTPSRQNTVRIAIKDALSQGDLSLDHVATRLSIGPRTLQRRLSDMGTSWRAEVEAVRYEHAVELLRVTHLPIRSVATRLGYADARVFRRSFRRWSDQSPDEFRRRPPSSVGGADPSR
ncbi:helix-turn-helix domain-containing protein [Nocardia sp. NPDC059091]|uniref:helix-turn-helix domain-containing protein n=1 Tax=unclassified Nocardia TaxID=2637762 RepID=UPI0036CD3D34